MVLTGQQILLVSASPRRKRLLEAACLDVRVEVPDLDEVWPGGSPEHGAAALARQKLDAVKCGRRLALAADTIVVIGVDRLGKPADRDAAEDMLARLSGRTHKVVTGFCVRKGSTIQESAVATEVSFRKISAEEINRYIDSGEAFDKTGAYAIQGGAAAFVDQIVGSYTNVVGLPVKEVLAALEAVA